jgi:hypothetical protein
MSKKRDGGPAFPRTIRIPDGDEWETVSVDGMTLRDWFAGMALPAAIREAGRERSIGDVVDFAYRIANAMIEEREQ